MYGDVKVVPLFQTHAHGHTHGWLPDTSGCDEGLPKERIINKRRTQTVLDNRLTPIFFELNLARWLRQYTMIVCPLSRHCRFVSALPSPHRSTVLSTCHPTNIRRQVPFFRCILFSDCKQGLLITLHLGRITVCTAKKRVLFGSRDVASENRVDTKSTSAKRVTQAYPSFQADELAGTDQASSSRWGLVC